MARALTAHEESRICLSHLEEAVAFNKEFQYDFCGADQVENVNSYLSRMYVNLCGRSFIYALDGAGVGDCLGSSTNRPESP